MLTLFNFANATAIVTGSFIGGAVLTTLGGGQTAYMALFAASSVCRAAALLVLSRLPRPVPHLHVAAPPEIAPQSVVLHRAPQAIHDRAA